MACTGSSKDNATCACTLFVARKSKGMKCKTCGHRLTSHIGASVPTPDIKPIEGSTAADNKYVNRLFRSLGATSVHETARKEMVEGFRPTSSGNVCCVFYSLLIPLTVFTPTAYFKEIEGQGNHQTTGILPCPLPEWVDWYSQAWKNRLLSLWGPGIFPHATACYP